MAVVVPVAEILKGDEVIATPKTNAATNEMSRPAVLNGQAMIVVETSNTTIEGLLAVMTTVELSAATIEVLTGGVRATATGVVGMTNVPEKIDRERMEDHLPAIDLTARTVHAIPAMAIGSKVKNVVSIMSEDSKASAVSVMTEDAMNVLVKSVPGPRIVPRMMLVPLMRNANGMTTTATAVVGAVVVVVDVVRVIRLRHGIIVLTSVKNASNRMTSNPTGLIQRSRTHATCNSVAMATRIRTESSSMTMEEMESRGVVVAVVVVVVVLGRGDQAAIIRNLIMVIPEITVDRADNVTHVARVVTLVITLLDRAEAEGDHLVVVSNDTTAAVTLIAVEITSVIRAAHVVAGVAQRLQLRSLKASWMACWRCTPRATASCVIPKRTTWRRTRTPSFPVRSSRRINSERGYC